MNGSNQMFRGAKPQDPVTVMRIYGLDFTSAPRPRKPMTVAACTLDGSCLHVDGLVALESFEVFENFLAQDGPWMAGMDFPFGQPEVLVRSLGWPDHWREYVGEVERLTMNDFESLVAGFRDSRPSGQKHPRRPVDALADSRSPLTMYRVPVGRMFFQGAPRLLRSGVSVMPCQATERRADADSRTAVEVYPALAARKVIGRRSYKSDTRSEQTAERATNRRALVDALKNGALAEHYGLTTRVPAALAEELASDPTGDWVDSVLCAVQAAWSWQRREEGFGIPREANPDEGWIVDPDTDPNGPHDSLRSAVH